MFAGLNNASSNSGCIAYSLTSIDMVALLKARRMLRLDQLIVGPALVS